MCDGFDIVFEDLLCLVMVVQLLFMSHILFSLIKPLNTISSTDITAATQRGKAATSDGRGCVPQRQWLRGAVLQDYSLIFLSSRFKGF